MRITALFLIAAAAGCGGATQTVVASPAGPPAPPPAAEAAPLAIPQQAPPASARRPSTVVGIARIHDVAKTLASIDRTLHLHTDVASLLASALAGQGADFVQLSGSIDAAIVMRPPHHDNGVDWLWAASVPITDAEAAVKWARQQGYEVSSTGPGSYRVHWADLRCDVLPASGAPSAHVVCSDTEESLTQLTPWLTRGLPNEPAPADDIWLEADFTPLQKHYLGTLAKQADDWAREGRSALAEVLHGRHADLLEVPQVIAREAVAWAADARAFDLGISIDPAEPSMRLTGTWADRSRTSWITQVFASVFGHAEAPPPMFYRLPIDAVSASWAHAVDPSLFVGVRKTVHEAFEAALELAGPMVPSADRHAFVSWIDGIPASHGTWAAAAGHLPHMNVPESHLTAAQAVEAAQAVVRTYVPWLVAGGEGDPAPAIAWLEQTQDVIQRAVADFEKSPFAPKPALYWLPSASFRKDPAGYPKGSAELDVTVKFDSNDVWDYLPQNTMKETAAGQWEKPPQPKGPPATGQIALHVVVVPDGEGHYWFGYSLDEASLRAHMAMVQKGAPRARQLAARTDLGPLQDAHAIGGMFRPFEDISANELIPSDMRKEIRSTLTQLPHKGLAPIYMLGSGTDDGAPTFSVEFLAGKEMVEDLAAAIGVLMAKANATGPLAPKP